MVGLATKKVEVEPRLVPRLAGGGSAPAFHVNRDDLVNLPDQLWCTSSKLNYYFLNTNGELWYTFHVVIHSGGGLYGLRWAMAHPHI